jgi:hypothetical protein
MHAGDHAISPDCRPDFVRLLKEALRSGTGVPCRRLCFFTPFMDMSEDQIVTLGAERGVAFEKTWSCHQGRDLQCWEVWGLHRGSGGFPGGRDLGPYRLRRPSAGGLTGSGRRSTGQVGVVTVLDGR